MDNGWKIAIVVVISLLATITGVFAYSQGLFGRNANTGCPAGQVVQSNGTCGAPPATATNYQVTLTYSDQLSTGSCTCTGVTNKNLYRLNGAWPPTSSSNLFATAATALTTTAAAISVLPTDNGFLGLWSDSGITSDYVIPAATKAANPGVIVDVAYGSWDNSGNLQSMFKVAFSGGTPASSGTAGPVINLVVRTASDDDTNLQFGTGPTTITGQGTGTKTIAATFYLQGASSTLATNKAYTIGRLLVASNETTFEQYWLLQSVSISFAGLDPYVGTVSISASGNNIYHNAGAKQWEVIIGPPLCAQALGSTPSGCNFPPSNANQNYRQTFTNILIGHRSGDPSTIAVTLTFQTYFTATGTGVLATAKVDAAKPNNVLITQLTQTWALRS